jgi:hypothetical protein
VIANSSSVLVAAARFLKAPWRISFQGAWRFSN